MGKKNFGVVSCNIHCNFTNYGSALQSWALCKIINKLGQNTRWQAKLVDYCPNALVDADPLNPIKMMWDTDLESQKLCEMTLPAIAINYQKFERFYNYQFCKTAKSYKSDNFNDIVTDEEINGFVCGSDTIFCIEEFGFDDAYYANYSCMKNGYSVSYAASFGDSSFEKEEDLEILQNRLKNFKSIGIRERKLLNLVQQNVDVPVQCVIDPTLLLSADDYEEIIAPRQEESKYLLLYTRRYNPQMEAFAEQLAKQNGWKIIEISLRATNAQKHRMFYEAGVEEFLSLVKNAEFVVTNSFHGMIFSVQFKKEFVIFSRERSDNKILELLELFGINNRILKSSTDNLPQTEIDYKTVHQRIEDAREKSISFLLKELEGCDE